MQGALECEKSFVCHGQSAYWKILRMLSKCCGTGEGHFKEYIGKSSESSSKQQEDTSGNFKEKWPIVHTLLIACCLQSRILVSATQQLNKIATNLPTHAGTCDVMWMQCQGFNSNMNNRSTHRVLVLVSSTVLHGLSPSKQKLTIQRK